MPDQVIARVCQIDKLRRLSDTADKLHAELAALKTGGEKAKTKLKVGVEGNRHDMQQTLEELRLHKKQIEYSQGCE